MARVLLGAGLAAVGAAAVVDGSVIWSRAGDQTDCFVRPGGKPDCDEVYEGKNLGIGMVVGGAVLAGVGSYLMLFTKTDTQVAVSPNGVAVGGRF